MHRALQLILTLSLAGPFGIDFEFARSARAAAPDRVDHLVAVDFQRDIRPILSQNCFLCHGPDEKDRKAGLRLDLREEALKPAKSGERSIVPGKPDESQLIARIVHHDEDERMPPTKTGKKLSEAEVSTLREWIKEGSPYAKHWSYIKPSRPNYPPVKNPQWVRNGLDYFILNRLEKEGLQPSPEADRATLVRRVSLDLIGLPPTPDEVRRFLVDETDDAYEALVDRLLERAAFGEHWARMWLDLARYADSAGYADDPLRTIWGYRDYVIDAFNKNKPFDQFTLEQIAGDLLPDPTDEQLVATAFHRNTMTNNEGGTNDEEFRSAAIVDRVNTTMAVWMGTSMACAQCHTHKYDPITQEDYFKFYALLNNTEDADKPDESPTLKLFTQTQKKERATVESQIAALEKTLSKPTPELLAGFDHWQKEFPSDLKWEPLKPSKGSYKRETSSELKDSTTFAVDDGPAGETYKLEFPLKTNALTGLQLTITHENESSEGKLTKITAEIVPPKTTIGGRFVRIELPGKEKILSLAEVQVYSGKENIASAGEATQSSTQDDAVAKLAIDGSTEGDFQKKSVTHTASSDNPWWELDLQSTFEINRLIIWNRTDGDTSKRLSNFKISILDEQRNTIWERETKEAPSPSVSLAVDSTRKINLTGMYADSGGDPAELIGEGKKGWSTDRRSSELVLLSGKAEMPETGAKLVVTLERNAKVDDRVRLSVAASSQPELLKFARVASTPLAALASGSSRTEKQIAELQKYYLREVAPELSTERARVATLKKQLEDMPPYSVPIMRELTGDKRRKTNLQHRGSYLDTGKEVEPGVPAAFGSIEKKNPTRLDLARWLVSEENPLTARVAANRLWEGIFGIGIVRTAEEFGSQGELPSHPELLDWLATDLIAKKWDVKAFLKMLVTSASYRQSSRVTPDLAERDPENRLLARGPRVRLPAESVRDQALFAAGLLSEKTKGPSVRPPRPSSGLSAAFGSSVDWKTSEGGERYRRALYTEWRRTSPYPSLTTFDAPNREICTIRRNRTNTPLQALVTLNDPVYIEAAQGLARRMLQAGNTVADRIRSGFELCLARPPSEQELKRLASLFGDALSDYTKGPGERVEQITNVAVAGDQAPELAAWTAVANVLLNLDETLMRP